jgi:Na+-translocating ferredoxin:NAD+ oxidoreductase RnfG subunit
MKTTVLLMLLACVAALTACGAYPMTQEERDRQAQAEQERRWKADNTNH